MRTGKSIETKRYMSDFQGLKERDWALLSGPWLSFRDSKSVLELDRADACAIQCVS